MLYYKSVKVNQVFGRAIHYLNGMGLLLFKIGD